MPNIDFLTTRVYCALQATQGQRFSLRFAGVPQYFVSAQCATFMYTCLRHFRERMIAATLLCQKVGSYWQLLEEEKKSQAQEKEKDYCVPQLLWTGWSMFSFVAVSGCMSPRLHPSFVPCLILFFIFSGQFSLSLTHTHTQRDVSWSVAGSL